MIKTGRPPDIKTKPIASRIPMELYIRLLTEASIKGQGISEYIGKKLATNDRFAGGGTTQEPKVIEKIVYRENTDKINNLKELVANILAENKLLKKSIGWWEEKLDIQIKENAELKKKTELMPKSPPIKAKTEDLPSKLTPIPRYFEKMPSAQDYKDLEEQVRLSKKNKP